MSTKVRIIDHSNGYESGVHPAGYLKVGPVEYNTPSAQSLDTISVAFNLIEPIAGKRAVIDALIISADRNVSGTTGAAIRIYEAAGPTDTTASSVLLTLNLLKQDKTSISGLKMLTNKGVWINADTDDATVDITALYYYIDNNGD